MIKIVSMEVGTIDATGTFQAASQFSSADTVAVQVQPQSSVTNSAVTGANLLVQLQSSAGLVEVVPIDMAGKDTNHGESSGPLATGDWQAVVVVAAADGFASLDPASGNLTRAFKVV